MALQIIDRRLAGKNKSVGNRERFVRRYKEQIADAVRRAVSQRGIRDMEQAESITIPRKDISEPVFHHGQGGIRDTVHPGNAEHVRGDRIERPQGGAGGRGSQASDSGEGEDDFTFTLTKEEFMQLFLKTSRCRTCCAPTLARTRSGSRAAQATARTASPTTWPCCAPCAALWAGALHLARRRTASCWRCRPNWTPCWRRTTAPARRWLSCSAASMRSRRASARFRTSTPSTCAFVRARRCPCPAARR